jgi:hypothetical protein
MGLRIMFPAGGMNARSLFINAMGSAGRSNPTLAQLSAAATPTPPPVPMTTTRFPRDSSKIEEGQGYIRHLFQRIDLHRTTLPEKGLPDFLAAGA